MSVGIYHMSGAAYTYIGDIHFSIENGTSLFFLVLLSDRYSFVVKLDLKCFKEVSQFRSMSCKL